MKIYKLNTNFKQMLADIITPVSIYYKIRDVFPSSLLLESSDFHGNENSFSYICCNPIASIKVENEIIYKSYPDGSSSLIKIDKNTDVPAEIDSFAKQFETTDNQFKFINNGLFGYISYDAVRYFDTVSISKKKDNLSIPDIYYAVYKNIIAINHFKNEAFIFCHSIDNQNNIGDIEILLQSRNIGTYKFAKDGSKTSSMTDDQYKEYVNIAKKHCHRGDVFQLVLSRRFTQKFKGDEFNVYRSLRSINPSPYLFYFDYGDFKIFGSSPEVQIAIKNRKAEIHPIAGSCKRTGDDDVDAQLIEKLVIDEKENSEHVMLVDLARNDLSRNSKNVKVEKYKEVQAFSHIIHLVSKVTGILREKAVTMQVVADTFPAGTLSGAPKHKAIELIEKYENINRNFYGGAIGFMDFSGNFNHAIMIRTFLSKDHQLHYQAGAGLVADSNPESELQETYNKLGALDKALEIAQTIV